VKNRQQRNTEEKESHDFTGIADFADMQ